jgi:hypothetical protein
MFLKFSIPNTYTVRETIEHSLELFNGGKLKKHRLRMDPDLYQLIENNTSRAPISLEEQTPSMALYIKPLLI